MKVNLTKTGSSLNALVEERLDTTTAPELDKILSSNIDGITELVLDFSHLDYISSAGLRVLLSMQKRMNKQGSMRILHCNESVMEVFEVTGFADILTLE